MVLIRRSLGAIQFFTKTRPNKCSAPSLRLFLPLSTYLTMAASAKRKAAQESPGSKSKKRKIEVPEYHLTASRTDDAGEVVWPAPAAQIERAREIIRECAKAQKPVLIMPDKDADGLSSGAILHHTLTALGLDSSLISVHFPAKGSNIHESTTRDVINETSPSYIFVLDQGSRKTPPLADDPTICLIIDHHFAEDGGFPEGSEYVTAHDCPPVATSSLLTYHICLPLHPDLSDKISWLAILGTHGDLGNTFKWQTPFPDMTAIFKQHPKSKINEAVARVNAPRRSAAYNVQAAWDAIISASDPEAIMKDQALEAASEEVKLETERCARAPPKFSADATISVHTISSKAQIHPVIATRWAAYLTSQTLEIVMCANEGYLPGKVNFSCRVAKGARARGGDDKVDIIKKLEDIASADPDLRERLGENFARGHKEASGGIVGTAEWEELKRLMAIGEGNRKKGDGARKKDANPAQKNTLTNYFAKK